MFGLHIFFTLERVFMCLCTPGVLPEQTLLARVIKLMAFLNQFNVLFRHRRRRRRLRRPHLQVPLQLENYLETLPLASSLNTSSVNAQFLVLSPVSLPFSFIL